MLVVDCVLFVSDMSEGLLIEELPRDLIGLDAEMLLQASNIPDMDNLDELLSQIPHPDDVIIPEPDSTTEPHPSGVDSASSATYGRFGDLVGEAEIKAAQEMSVPANTKKSTSWAVKVWKDWSTHRHTVSPNDWPPHLMICSLCELN